MNTSIDTEISKLKRLNLIAGALHLASLLAILFLANDAKLPVNAIYLTEAPGTGNLASLANNRTATSDTKCRAPAIRLRRFSLLISVSIVVFT